ncbi:serine/threonine-protein kinase [Streptomyces sp. NPDC008313]|uniref:serine/threonine-protein kinase n=1 Tax=Streptomyces sp. NPDC008313 TaxID=3364826 RepID=UPI0036EC3CA9
MSVLQGPSRADTRLTTVALSGRYRLDALLGRGGAADVYRGVDLRLRRPVAVKVFRPGGDAQTEDRFTEEAVLVAGLHHPGLVTVYDSGQAEEGPYLVMQLIEGRTLRQRIAATRLDPAEACALATALAHALAHVHEAGIVHRDVKPGNILLDAEGTPYLTDFGISRLIDNAAQTRTEALVGTAAYLAPEQVLGRPAGPAADIYALGLVVLECLKGELEYDGAPLEAAIARLHRPPALPDTVSDDLARLLRAMTALKEGERPDAHTCAEAFTALAAHAAADDATRTAVHAVPAASRVPAPRRPRGRALASAGAAVAALLGLTLTGSVGGPSTGGAQAAGPARDTQGAPDADPPVTGTQPPGTGGSRTATATTAGTGHGDRAETVARARTAVDRTTPATHGSGPAGTNADHAAKDGPRGRAKGGADGDAAGNPASEGKPARHRAPGKQGKHR